MDARSGSMQTSWCTTRVCEGSVAEVAALLESHGAGRARFTVPGASLVLEPPRGVPGVSAVSPRRVHRARLRYSPWAPAARVTVEVEPWSPGRTEVLIRPARRLPPGADAYLRAAAGLVDVLAREVVPPALAPPAPMAGVPLRRAS